MNQEKNLRLNSQSPDASGLVAELEEARRHVTELEAKLAASQPADRSRPERKKLEASIEFIGDFDIIQAAGVDISSHGICFEVSESLAFDMKVELEDEEQVHRGRLVWMKSLAEDGYRLGFQFLAAKPETDF